MRVLVVTDSTMRAAHFQKRYADVFNDSRARGNVDNIQVVGWGAPIMGYRADLVIIADRPNWTPAEQAYYNNWFETALRCRVLPQGVIMDFS